jgi:CRISPR/Cas system-associated exonuclease Cas4 (RecB family)
MPDNEHHDSILAYNFYRLASGAKRIFLLYDTRSEGLQTGEVSRFVYQLKYHYRVPIVEKLLTFDVEWSKPETITVNKNPHVTEQLRRFLKGGDKALSASAVNTYINCPLKFYWLYVEGLSEEDEVSETVEAGIFGSIFHQVMQDIYEPLIGRSVPDDVLTTIKKDDDFLTHRIESAFAKHFHKTSTVKKLTGRDFLVGEIIRKYVKQMIDADRKNTPFVYLASELKIQARMMLKSGKEVNLKGFIDRIDNVNGVIRILDYKTGTGTQTFRDIPQLFDQKSEKRPKDLMQVLMYALLYDENLNDAGCPVEPGIYYLRNLFSQSFTTRISRKENASAPTVIVENLSGCKEEFKEAFINCSDDIFSPDVPFMQTEIAKHCDYCPFAGICGR